MKSDFDQLINVIYNNLDREISNVVLCAIWYRLYNSKNVKDTHGGVSPLSEFNLTKSSTPPWLLFSYFLNCRNGTKSCKAPQIVFPGYIPVVTPRDYLGPCQRSMMKMLVFNNFLKKSPQLIFVRVLNTPLNTRSYKFHVGKSHVFRKFCKDPSSV